MIPITVVTDEIRRRLIEELTAPGALFEVTTESIRRIPYRVFKRDPKKLKEYANLIKLPFTPF